ncbi:MAG: hypothetical protein HQ464_02220 [Planctomycetes bacterium]|nr:hypothetical protein [Planctomycetota bacterium]
MRRNASGRLCLQDHDVAMPLGKDIGEEGAGEPVADDADIRLHVERWGVDGREVEP